MVRKRLDLRLEDEKTLTSLELCLELTKQTSYAGAIKDIINNYPRMVERLANTENELKDTQKKSIELSSKVSTFLSALDNLKTHERSKKATT